MLGFDHYPTLFREFPDSVVFRKSKADFYRQAYISLTNHWDSSSFKFSASNKQLLQVLGTEKYYRKTSNISRTLVGNKIVDNSDVVGASPVGAAPTTSSFST